MKSPSNYLLVIIAVFVGLLIIGSGLNLVFIHNMESYGVMVIGCGLLATLSILTILHGPNPEARG